MIVRDRQLSASGVDFELVVDAGDSTLDVDAHWFVTVLKEKIRDAANVADKYVVSLGWTFVRLRVSGSIIQLEESVMDSAGRIHWRAGAGEALNAFRMQTEFCSSFGLEEQFATIQETCIVCNKLDARRGTFHRLNPTETGGSGWFLGCPDRGHSHVDVKNLSSIALGAAAVLCPESLPFLALPAEFRAVFVGDRVKLMSNGRAVVPSAESMADLWLAKRALRSGPLAN